jgi:hypothetical protein
MVPEREITARQQQSDTELGLQCFEEWQNLTRWCRLRAEHAYSPALKTALEELSVLATQGAARSRDYLQLVRAEPSAASPDGQCLRPDVPEWRPGHHESSSTD